MTEDAQSFHLDLNQRIVRIAWQFIYNPLELWHAVDSSLKGWR